MDTVTANGIAIAFETFGAADAEPMLLVSGLGTQMIRWDDGFCRALAACGYRVIRFDNRDAGLSTHMGDLPSPDFGALAASLMAGVRPEVPYTLLDMTADAVGLLDALGIEWAHVVGRSMGGMIAQCMAAEYPGRVRSLVSIMSSTGNPDLPQAAPEVMALMQRPRPDPVTDPEGFAEVSIAFARCITGSGAPFDAEAQGELALEEARRAHDPAGYGRQLAAMVTAGDRRARLATVRAPTLVIHGADDPLIPAACGADTAASVPGAEFLLIEGMGHDLPPAFWSRIVAAIDVNAKRAA
ncbi:alpha/beta fold hydrolase [Psychromarinibacter halotolerans]|uniref:Alpha/beta fold hydrolase n=1 Tax=Psychromarinibacter halotolerans TaxID=1775175 RepID=A0ABV7GVB3_9RHOB|nr:alpha/beta fold hydrolase [Psychromarinibacter halotolerans]MDF0594524.1 alpha/beta fold hydrolase [Psychromarinibacter halotolerans]